MAILATILWVLKRVFWFVKDNWKVVLPVLAVIVIAGFVFRSCNRPPRFDEKEILRAQQAIATQDRAEMEKVVTDSLVREKGIVADVANAKAETINATIDARRQAQAMSNEDLAAFLNERGAE